MEMFPLLWVMFLLTCWFRGEFVCGGHSQLVECNASEKEALLDFKKGLKDVENLLSSWQGDNCCQWWGLTCDNTTGAVISVDLHNTPYLDPFQYQYRFSNLSGEIRPSLTKLKSLRYLDLSFNTFNGKIPDFLSSLENLQYLNLSCTGFSGAIPPSLGNFSRLQFLELSSPPGQSPLTADNFDWVSGLVSLKYLAMRELEFFQMRKGWVESLNKLPFLIELHLPYCLLPNFTLSLPSINFTSLAVLDLIGNSFNSKLPNWLSNVSGLVSVDISESGMIGRIPLGFSELPNLQTLKLSHNSLSTSYFQIFKGSWEKIEVLDLSYNHLLGRLSSSLGNMTSVIYLDLSANNISGGIPSFIGRLCNLQYIDLSYDNLTGGFPEFLEGTENCPSKGPFPSLQNFKSSGNHLSGKLPNWMGHLKNLVVLDLTDNLLHAPIPESFGNLQHLSQLRLASNKLNGSLPDVFRQLSGLTELDVSSNQLTGVISKSYFSSLSKILKFLDLSDNSFSFKVSSNWVSPFQLSYLYMHSCNLGPSFPTWLRSQKQILSLDLSNNSISGYIPKWFWSTSGNITHLHLSFNHLKGHLPNPLNISPFATVVELRSNLFEGSIPLPLSSDSMKILDLSSNQFSDPIPEIMPQNLAILLLSNNHLTGGIPASVKEMQVLQVMDLSGNNLTGTIPSSIGNCSLIFALDLQNNNLSGEIPASLGQLIGLQILHLSNNRFSGEIPDLQFLRGLGTLDLGNNMLTGHIPRWIGAAFPNLRVLSLRSNSFSGEIPEEICNLNRLQVLDLADNKFNGTIPFIYCYPKGMATQPIPYDNSFWFEVKPRMSKYQENIAVIRNGQYQKYTKTLPLLTTIDLSGNNLHGKLPEKITKLEYLLVLNLSRNHISDRIPESISKLHQLLSLDLSSNNFSGPIPQSMSSMSFLEYLDLSNNNLSGRIPFTGQMTTFNASSFAGNCGLCGDPLAWKCTNDNSNNDGLDDGRKDEADDGDGLVNKWFYMSIGLGFAVGLLLPYLIFAMKRSWGGVYFAFVDITVCRLTVTRRRI